jgi:hypothetical protein
MAISFISGGNQSLAPITFISYCTLSHDILPCSVLMDGPLSLVEPLFPVEPLSPEILPCSVLMEDKSYITKPFHLYTNSI